MTTCRDVLICKKTMQLMIECYSVYNLFPREEQFGLTNQIRRCYVSIASNIAEGYRRRNKEFLKISSVVISSLFEIQTQIAIATHLKFISENQFNNIYFKVVEG